jgi:hypothetical protein
MKKFVLLMLSPLAFALVGSNGEGFDHPPAPEEPISREAQFRVAYMGGVLLNGIELFVVDRGQYPSSLAELCATPFVAVSCGILRNPYTGEPITGANEVGDISFVGGGDSLVVTVRIGPGVDITIDLDQPARIWYCTEPESQEPISPCPSLDEFRAMDDPSKRAYSVARLLLSSVDALYARRFGETTQGEPEPPHSLDDLAGWLTQMRHAWVNDGIGYISNSPGPDGYLYGQVWIDWDDLLNDFTGEAAHEVTAPSPGNFRYYFDVGEGLWFLEAYGNQGAVVFKERAW